MNIYLLFENYSEEERVGLSEDGGDYDEPKLLKAYANKEKAEQEKVRLESLERVLRKRRDECIFFSQVHF